MKYYQNGNVPKNPGMYFIYGDGGTGKTTISKQFEGKKILFSFDLSTNPIYGKNDFDVAIVENDDAPIIQDVVDKWVGRAINDKVHDVIIIDNVSALQNLVLENIDNASKDSRQNYQKLQLWFRQLGTALRNSGKTIYATAHQLENDSGGLEGNGRFKPDMNDKTFNAFTSMFDLVGRIYKEKGKRMIDLDPEKGNHAKNRLDDRTLINANELILKENKTDDKTNKEEK